VKAAHQADLRFRLAASYNRRGAERIRSGTKPSAPDPVPGAAFRPKRNPKQTWLSLPVSLFALAPRISHRARPRRPVGRKTRLPSVAVRMLREKSSSLLQNPPQLKLCGTRLTPRLHWNNMFGETTEHGAFYLNNPGLRQVFAAGASGYVGLGS